MHKVGGVAAAIGHSGSRLTHGVRTCFRKVLDLPGSTPEQLLLIGGKQGIVYLLDRCVPPRNLNYFLPACLKAASICLMAIGSSHNALKDSFFGFSNL